MPRSQRLLPFPMAHTDAAAAAAAVAALTDY